ncbi:hypothetical protein [uncultured Thiothrix sp.]|uniref:hypothetical protein n=1 Tax=uncultured Thiothrix sp. TaxID=223185 RepID=UPI00260D3D22|nr:hypothetical protein [uncultured Thiothrix sp.]
MKYFPLILGRSILLFIGLIIDIYIAHITSIEARGEFHLILTSTTLLSSIFLFGLHNSIVVKVANTKNLYYLFAHIIIITPLIIAMPFFIYLIPQKFLGARYDIISIICFLLTMIILFRSFFLGISNDIYYIFLMLSDKILLLFFLAFYSSEIYQEEIFIDKLYLYSLIISLTMGFLLIIKLKINNLIIIRKEKINFTEITSFSAKNFFGDLFFQLNYRVGVYFIAYSEGNESISLYMAVFLISQLPQQIPLFLSTLLFRDSAQDFNSSRTIKIASYSFLIALILSAILYVFIDKITLLFYGNQYAHSTKYISYFLLSSILLSPTLVIANSLLGKKCSFEYMLIFGLGFFVTIVSISLSKLTSSIEIAASALAVSAFSSLTFSILFLRKNA